jgi:hypothetical protein
VTFKAKNGVLGPPKPFFRAEKLNANGPCAETALLGFKSWIKTLQKYARSFPREQRHRVYLEMGYFAILWCQVRLAGCLLLTGVKEMPFKKIPFQGLSSRRPTQTAVAWPFRKWNDQKLNGHALNGHSPNGPTDASVRSGSGAAAMQRPWPLAKVNGFILKTGC